MSNRPSSAAGAGWLADRLLRDIGRELRIGRIIAGRRQDQVASAIGRHRSHVSRVENGRIRGLTVPDIASHARTLGLKPWIRLFPVARRPMDAAQLDLWNAFRQRIDDRWRVDLEVPMPVPGDLRAADAVLSRPGCRCVVEVITRLADLEAQARAGRVKVRDLKADRLILVVAANPTNRRAIAAAGRSVTDSFPIGTRAAIHRLETGDDPGGDALVLVRPPSAQQQVRRDART